MRISFNSASIRATSGFRRWRLSGFPRYLRDAALFSICWLVFGFLSLCWSLIAALLYPVLPWRFGQALGRSVISGGFRMYIGLLRFCGLLECDLTALDAAAVNASLVIAPNHPGRLDAVLMISRLPQAVCISKASLWDSWFLGGAVRLAGYIRNDTPMKMIKTAVEEIRSGHNLLIFPEGTRSTGSLGSFGGGFALIAKLADAPVQTVFIECPSRYLGKDWPLFKMPAFPVVIRIGLGQSFAVPEKVEAFVAQLENYFRDELERKTALRM